MKKQILVLTAPFVLLAGCSESEEPAAVEEAPEVDLAAGSGAYLVTNADGSMTLNYATADGETYGGVMDGPEPATWAVTDGRVCVDPPGEPAEGEPALVCLNAGPINPDGTWAVSTDEVTTEVTMRRLDAVAIAPADQVAAGSYLVEGPEDGPLLVVWLEDGTSYLARNVGHGTWRAVDGQRCELADGEEEESCSTPGEMGEDGSFEVADNPGGPITVQML